VRVRPHLLAGDDLPPEPLQTRSLDKRRRLKEAALAVFGEKGYEGTSIMEVAQRAKLAVGGFYQHFRSKRQLLLVLMDELLEGLNQLDLAPRAMTDVRSGIRALLSNAFSSDLRYLGAYRAWQEAVLSDPDLMHKQKKIQAWTTARVKSLFQFLQQLPGARPGVDVAGLARVMDSFFWSLLSEAARLSKIQLHQRIDAATHLIYHAMFRDLPGNVH
jgi:AcrR family transcriptional regulator